MKLIVGVEEIARCFGVSTSAMYNNKSRRLKDMARLGVIRKQYMGRPPHAVWVTTDIALEAYMETKGIKGQIIGGNYES